MKNKRQFVETEGDLHLEFPIESIDGIRVTILMVRYAKLESSCDAKERYRISSGDSELWGHWSSLRNKCRGISPYEMEIWYNAVVCGKVRAVPRVYDPVGVQLALLLSLILPLARRKVLRKPDGVVVVAAT